MTANIPRRRILTPQVREAKERRLAELEETAAIYGNDTPPHITTEIEDLQSELELVDIIQRKVDPNVTAIVKQTDYGELLSKFIGDHARRLSSIELWQKTRDERIEADEEKQAQLARIDTEKREIRQRDLDAQLVKISVNVRTVAIISIFSSVLVVILLIVLLLR